MSSGKGYTQASRVIDLTLGGASYSPPAIVYIALFNAPFVDGGTLPAEVSSAGTAYARVAVANTLSNWPLAVNGRKANANQILFQGASASWGIVVALAIMDALTGGNVLYYGSLASAVNVTPGDAVQIQSGALVIVEG